MKNSPAARPEVNPPAVLPYGRQCLDDDDIAAVLKVLQGDFLTQGPMVERLEQELCRVTGAGHTIAVANGTLALETVYGALGVGPGVTVWVPANTFVATAAAAEKLGAKVEFLDIERETGNLDMAALALRLTRVPAPDLVVPVHFAGLPCDMQVLLELKQTYGFAIVEDAAHGLGASYRIGAHWWRPGEHPGVSAAILSFHPVKPITSAEGGAVLTEDATLAERVRLLRGQGIDRSPEASADHPHYAPMVALGTNARLSELHAALGLSQLKKLERFRCRRAEIAARYRRELRGVKFLESGDRGREHAWHLFVIQVDAEVRDCLRELLLARGVGTQVHYHPVPYQPWFQGRNGEVEVPVALDHAQCSISLPLYPALTAAEVGLVIDAVNTSVAELCLRA